MLKNFGPHLNDFILRLVTLEHKIDPLFRDRFDRLFQRPLADLTQALLRVTHPTTETKCCQEVPLKGEGEITKAIVEQMQAFTQRQYKGKTAERAGNTKNYGF